MLLENKTIEQKAVEKLRTAFRFLILIIMPAIWLMLVSPSAIFASMYTAASCSQADVQSAINAAVDGDTINIPAGTCTWTTSVTWTNKNINLIGAGQGSCTYTSNSSGSSASCDATGATNIIPPSTGSAIVPTITNTAEAQFRISNIMFSGSATNSQTINIQAYNAPTWSYGWRIDHITFNLPSNGPEGEVVLWGVTWGLVDHNIFIQHNEAAVVTASFMASDSNIISNLYGAYQFSLAAQPGTQYNLYIEDNTILFVDAGGWTVFDTYYNGARVVLRHNTIYNGLLVYGHDTQQADVNSVWLEAYNNNMYGSAYGNAGGYPFRLTGGGTGVVYNNTSEGYGFNSFLMDDYRSRGVNSLSPLYACDGTHVWEGDNGTNPDSSAPGWPCLAQVGRVPGGFTISTSGDQQPSPQGSFPLYLWNNGPQCSCSGLTYPVSGSSCTAGACDNSMGGYSQSAAYIKNTAHSTSGFGNGDVDYCVNTSQPSGCGTHTLTYTAYTYPHPLQSGGAGSGADPQLTVTESGTGTGTVASSPSGINCGSTCSANYNGGTVVTLTATPSGGSTFTGWGGGCSGTGACVVTMNAATSVMATFTAPAVPPSPTNLAINAITSSQITLSWTDNSGNESGFKIERCSGSACSNFAQIASVAANVNIYSNSGLSAGTNYSYRVRAYNSAGNSGYSNTASASTISASPLLLHPVISRQLRFIWGK